MIANAFDVISLMWAQGRLAMKDVNLIAPWQANIRHGPSSPVSIFWAEIHAEGNPHIV